jgi:hypothetical protein
MKEILDRLNDDNEYYGNFGKQYLSNSDIGALLNNPRKFKQTEKTPAMLIGNYFHVSMTEPEKKSEFQIIDVSNRNTNAYKSLTEMALLAKEADQVNGMVKAMKGNKYFFDEIYADDAEYEVPAIIEIEGLLWKGKTDIKRATKLIDLKTSGDINRFRYSAYDYNYDSQAWIYQQMFGVPMEFFVVDKNTFELAVVKCSEEFLERGKQKVLMACEAYKKFFGENPTHTVEQYYHEFIL